MENAKEIGRITLNESTDIIVQTGTYEDEERVDIRKFVKTEKYTGFTKQGIQIPRAKWKEIKAILDKV